MFIARAYVSGLGQNGFEILHAASGEQALLTLGKEKIDLILLDIIMPAMNGFEVLKAIKENRATKNIPVIVLSNLGQESDIQKSRELGAIDHLVKVDYSIADIAQKLRSHLHA